MSMWKWRAGDQLQGAVGVQIAPGAGDHRPTTLYAVLAPYDTHHGVTYIKNPSVIYTDSMLDVTSRYIT